jgi:hypothetical protein
MITKTYLFKWLKIVDISGNASLNNGSKLEITIFNKRNNNENDSIEIGKESINEEMNEKIYGKN